MSSAPEPILKHVTPMELVETLKAGTGRPIIIDVRGDDYAEGHIRSAVNHPEEGFYNNDTVDALVEKYKEEETIVFHCMQSQVRGPFCAKRFLSRLDVLLEDAGKKPEVKVLTGGYKQFSEVSHKVFIHTRRHKTQHLEIFFFSGSS